VQRADSLLRQNKWQEQIFPLLREMSLEPAAVPVIAQRLADKARWRSAFLNDLTALTQPQLAAHGAILMSLAATEAPPTEAEAAAYVRKLVAERDYRRAWNVWMRLARLNHRESALLHDGDFEHVYGSEPKSPLTPFEWAQGDVLDASVRVDTAPNSRAGSALHVQARSGASGILLKQLLVLRPGAYRFSYMVHADDVTSRAGFTWVLNCAASEQELPMVEAARPQASSEWSRIDMKFHVPADCVAQQLGLRATGGIPSAIAAWFDDVRIASLNRVL